MAADSNKPPARLVQFASALGWNQLRMFQDRVQLPGSSRRNVIRHYISGRSNGDHRDLFLHIAEAPIGQTRSYFAIVYAMRYRICTGRHFFTLYRSADDINAEADRHSQWLHRHWFVTLPRRREFRSRHPECAGITWTHLQHNGLPTPHR